MRLPAIPTAARRSRRLPHRTLSTQRGLRLDSLVLVPNHAMRITVEQMVDERRRLDSANERRGGRTLAAERAGSSMTS